MSYELQNPKQLVQNTFTLNQIHTFVLWTRVVSAVVAFATLVRWVFHCFVGNKMNGSSGRESEDSSLLRRDSVEVS
jgi:hypothetical protein